MNFDHVSKMAELNQRDVIRRSAALDAIEQAKGCRHAILVVGCPACEAAIRLADSARERNRLSRGVSAHPCNHQTPEPPIAGTE